MIRIFKHYVPKSILALGIIDIAVLYVAHYAGYYVRLLRIDQEPAAFGGRVGEATHFVVIMTVALLALGLYQRDACRELKLSFTRLFIAFLLSFLWFSVVFYLYPDISEWRSVFAISYSFAFVGLFVNRVFFSNFVDHEALKQRLLVLGAGNRARRVQELESDGLTRGFSIIQFLRMSKEEKSIDDAREFSSVASLVDFAAEGQIDEIITATEERRGALPVRELLDCKLSGIAITDYSSFLERETGVVELDGLIPSWLIYSDGFTGGRVDAVLKRFFDIAISLGFLIFTLPVFGFAALAVKLTSKGPVLYRQERVGRFGKPFTLMKFRSMKVGAEDEEGPKWAEVDDPRTTTIGAMLRITRIDELPQIFNVLKGDMSFVGPRPERPFFVKQLVEELPYYTERHQVKPGITGWAQLNYPYGATVEDAKQKLQYDLYYVKNCTIFIDALILIQTARVILFTDGAR